MTEFWIRLLMIPVALIVVTVLGWVISGLVQRRRMRRWYSIDWESTRPNLATEASFQNVSALMEATRTLAKFRAATDGGSPSALCMSAATANAIFGPVSTERYYNGGVSESIQGIPVRLNPHVPHGVVIALS